MQKRNTGTTSQNLFMSRIVHIGVSDKFLIDFKLFNNEFCDTHNHNYFFIGPKNEEICDTEVRKPLKNFFHMIRNRKIIRGSDVICLHGVFDSLTLVFLWCFPAQIRKSYWFIWGGDLHVYELRNSSFRKFFKELLRKRVLANIPNYVTYIPNDFENAKKNYNKEARLINCILYPSNIAASFEESSQKINEYRVLLGNSANPRNRHIEMIDVLKDKLAPDMTAVFILSYGDRLYAERVKSHAKNTLKCKLEFVEKLVSKADYMEILNSVDVACMFHTKQMGMGTTIQLISLGKEVVFSEDSEALSVLRSLGLSLEAVKKETNLRKKLSSSHNKDKIRDLFSDKALKNQLDIIYSGKIHD